MTMTEELSASRARETWQGGYRGRRRTPILRIVLLAFLAISIVCVIAWIIFLPAIHEYFAFKRINQFIDISSLPSDEKLDAKQTVKQFITDARKERLPREKWEPVRREYENGIIGQFSRVINAAQMVGSSGLDSEQKRTAFEALETLLRGYGQKKVSDEKIAGIAQLAPRDKNGMVVSRQWSDGDLKKIIAAAEAAIKDKQIETTDQKPDFAPEIRRLVKLMKDAMRTPSKEQAPPASDTDSRGK